ncbi:hypothetical protein V2J09_016867 [Rumex salicifolius]
MAVIGPVRSIKEFAESSAQSSSIPSSYAYNSASSTSSASDHDQVLSDSIPVIDLSLLVSSDPDQRSTAVHQLGTACREWGFFMVVNHGVPEEIMNKMMDGVQSFFNLTVEEKREFQGSHVLDPIRCGTSFNSSVEKVFFWRDFLKVFVHPNFHFPHKPQGFSDLALDYCKRTREVAEALLGGISESLGLEEDNLLKCVNWESGFQIFIANLYPPCPQPDVAMGMPPHSDHGLLTLLAQNQIDGLHIQHNDSWVPVNAIPNSFLVNTGDHLEIISNGKYTSNIHRAVVNNKATRISLAIANGPSLDTVVGPAPDLVNNEESPAVYKPMKYRDYLELQQSNQLDGKSCLDCVRLVPRLG